MKNKFFMFTALLMLVLVISACGNNSNGQESSSASNSPSNAPAPTTEASGTITYESELGPVEIPANPQRIVALTYAPNIVSLDGPVVGVDQWSSANPLFSEKMSGIEVVSEADLEKISALEPDLIIAGTEMKTLDELKKIAPTVAYTWGKLSYLDQQVEIGKILNKEQEAKAWVDDFSKRAADFGKEVKAKYGDNVTVSVFEAGPKEFYIFGEAWARGTEILYQAMELSMTEKGKQDALGPGYYSLSLEVLPEYAGDFIVLSRPSNNDNSFMDSEIWKNIPAVKNNQVITIDTEASSYSDPISLESMMAIFKKGMLGE